MGHAKVDTAINVYTQVLDGSVRAAADRVGAELFTLAGALALSRLLTSLLYGVSPFDGATFAATVVVLLALVVLASYVPARRASRVNPTTALRST